MPLKLYGQGRVGRGLGEGWEGEWERGRGYNNRERKGGRRARELFLTSCLSQGDRERKSSSSLFSM